MRLSFCGSVLFASARSLKQALRDRAQRLLISSRVRLQPRSQGLYRHQCPGRVGQSGPPRWQAASARRHQTSLDDGCAFEHEVPDAPAVRVHDGLERDLDLDVEHLGRIVPVKFASNTWTSPAVSAEIGSPLAMGTNRSGKPQNFARTNTVPGLAPGGSAVSQSATRVYSTSSRNSSARLPSTSTTVPNSWKPASTSMLTS